MTAPLTHFVVIRRDPPLSLLTMERPDLWERALNLATGVAGFQCDQPGADGAIGYYPSPLGPPRLVVPEGGMEWLLHEVGHWLASTPEERRLQNYGVSESEIGHDGQREIEAWAFEEIVLAPFGSARNLAPPWVRNGAAFAKAGPLPARALTHAWKQMGTARVPVERWRAVYGEWVRWGRSRLPGHAPWEAVN